MHILPDGPGRENPPAPPHDPLICGIDFQSSCDQCRAAFLARDGRPPPSPAAQLWVRLLRRFRFLAAAFGDPLLKTNAPAPPRSLQLVAQLVAALAADPQCRAALLAVIGPELTAGIEKIFWREFQRESLRTGRNGRPRGGEAGPRREGPHE